MRVLIDARYLDGVYSGIGTYSRLLVEHLARVDTETEYQILVRKGFRDSLAVGANFEVISWGPKPVSWKTYFRMHDAIGVLKPDVVHCLAPPAPILYDGPLMITLHDLQPFNDPEFSGRRIGPARTAYNLFYSWAYPTVINRSKWVLCDSNATREDLVRLMPDMASRAIVVSPGLEPAEGGPVTEGQIDAVRAKFGLHERYCLYYGSTRPNKNLVRLVEAFQLAVSRNPERLKDLHLVLVVRKDRFFREVEKLVARSRLRDRVRVLDQMPAREQRALLAGSEAFVFPTKYEGFGFPPLEAMREGVPVLAGRSGALPEVCGDAALLVDPFDLDDIAAGILGIVNDEELRETLVARGHDRIGRFDWQRTAEMVRDVYRLLF